MKSQLPLNSESVFCQADPFDFHAENRHYKMASWSAGSGVPSGAKVTSLPQDRKDERE